MKEAIFEFFEPLGAQLAVFITSMLPVIELRGGIPFGAALGLPIWQAYILGVLGNLLPVPIILLFVRKVFDFMRKYERSRRLVERFEARFARRAEKMKKVTFVSLMLFVSIPLPITGAWTGSGIAALFEVPFKNAMLAVTLGVLIAGGIVSAIAYGFLGVLSILI